MYRRQLLGCRRVVPGTSYPWWPSFPGSPSSGAHSLRHGIGSKTCTVVVPVLDPDHACHCRGPGGGGVILTTKGLTSGVLVGNIMHLLLTVAVLTGV
jgi:hypothetical protein